MHTQTLPRTTSFLNLFPQQASINIPRTVEPQSGPIFTLPHEIFVRILSFTPLSTLPSFAYVCVQLSEHVRAIFSTARSVEEIISEKVHNLGLSLEGRSLFNELLLVRNLTRNCWTNKVDYPFTYTKNLSTHPEASVKMDPTLRKLGTLYLFNHFEEDHFWNTPQFQKRSLSPKNIYPLFHEGSLPISKPQFKISKKGLEYKEVAGQKEHTFVKIDREKQKLTYVYYDYSLREQKSVDIDAKTLFEELADFLKERPAKLFFYQVGESLYLSTQRTLTCFLRLFPNPSPSLEDWRTLSIPGNFRFRFLVPMNDEIYLIGANNEQDHQFRHYRLDGTLLFSENIAPEKTSPRYLQGCLVGNHLAYLIHDANKITSLCLRELTSKKVVKEFKLPQITDPTSFHISLSAERSLLIIRLKKLNFWATNPVLKDKTLLVSLLTERVIDLEEREYDDGYSHKLEESPFFDGKVSFSFQKSYYRATINSAWDSDSATYIHLADDF